MASNARPKRPKTPPPRLNLEEMEQDPSMKGMLSFLEDSPAERLEMLRRRAQVETASVIPFPPQSEPTGAMGAGDVLTVGGSETDTVGVSETHTVSVSEAPTPLLPEAADVQALSSGSSVLRKAPASETPIGGKSETPTGGTSQSPTVGVPVSDSVLQLTLAPDYVDVRHVRLRPVRNIQDGLTPGEFLLLTEMFKAGVATPGTKDRTLRAGGYRTMSDRTGVDPKTVKRNRNGLIAKYCIRPIGANTFTAAAIFQVLHFENILTTWRSKGLVWVRRSGRSVDLVSSPQQTPPVGVSDPPTVGILNTPTVGELVAAPVGASESTTGEMPSPSGGETPPLPVGVSPTHLSTTSKHKTSSSRWPLAVKALLEATGCGDDDAVRRMGEAAIAHAPDATDEEIAHFIREEAPRVLRNKALDNPMGLLIRQVPRRFAGEGFRLYRDGVRRKREADEAIRQEQIADARRILASPSEHSRLDVQWAEQILEEGAGK